MFHCDRQVSCYGYQFRNNMGKIVKRIGASTGVRAKFDVHLGSRARIFYDNKHVVSSFDSVPAGNTRSAIVQMVAATKKMTMSAKPNKPATMLYTIHANVFDCQTRTFGGMSVQFDVWLKHNYDECFGKTTEDDVLMLPRVKAALCNGKKAVFLGQVTKRVNGKWTNLQLSPNVRPVNSGTPIWATS